MSPVSNVFSRIALGLKSEPAMTLMLLNIIVVVAAHYGWHVTVDQLTTVAIVTSAFVGVIVRGSVTPNVKVPTPVVPPITSFPFQVKD
jgi:hypothetical protein